MTSHFMLANRNLEMRFQYGGQWSLLVNGIATRKTDVIPRLTSAILLLYGLSVLVILVIATALHVDRLKVSLAADLRAQDEFNPLRPQTIVRGKKMVFGQEAFPSMGVYQTPGITPFESLVSSFTRFILYYNESIVFRP